MKKSIVNKIKELFIRGSQLRAGEKLPRADAEYIESMFAAMGRAPEIFKPSKYWVEINRMNLTQLSKRGYDNFKRTVALNYFTWGRIMPWDPQIRHLARELGVGPTLRAIFRFFSGDPLTGLLAAYYDRKIADPRFDGLAEPPAGNPRLVRTGKGALVSQDLINSFIETGSIIDGIGAAPGHIMELGAGYGRNAYVLLSLFPRCKYVIADIPPALWVSQKYLSALFPGKKVFRFRDFAVFAEVKDEFDAADIAFLLPHQLQLLSGGLADLVINISSLHEMRKEQIRRYLHIFDSLLRSGGHFYTKQWKEGHVLFENVVIRREDYPYPKGWTPVFDRDARVQTEFFEGLYRKG